jgi:hypothetical protein
MSPPRDSEIPAERYEVREVLGQRERVAWDKAAKALVVLRHVPAAAAGDALRERFLRAQAVTHPNVCRLFDLVPTTSGVQVAMEYVAGESLRTFTRNGLARGGIDADVFRQIAGELAAGLAAIHGAGLVHGGVSPDAVRVALRSDVDVAKAALMDLAFADEYPAYFSPERARTRTASAEDDVYALGLTLLEMWTGRTPDPGYDPCAVPLAKQARHEAPSALAHDEVRQVFRCFAKTPARRLRARDVHMFEAAQTSSQPIVPTHRIDPGPLARQRSMAFVPGAQALLVTYATHAQELIGTLYPLNAPSVTLGRSAEHGVSIAEPTVSATHLHMTWANGAWTLEDRGSTNGTYRDTEYARVEKHTLLQGGELQVGEVRLLLVNFEKGSPLHQRAQRYLAERDALTRLFTPARFVEELEYEARFAEWIDAPLSVARFALTEPAHERPGQLSILAMLATRQMATKIAGRTALFIPTESLLAGSTAPLRFAMVMTGVAPAAAKTFVAQVVSELSGAVPPGITLAGSLAVHSPGGNARALVAG